MLRKVRAEYKNIWAQTNGEKESQISKSKEMNEGEKERYAYGVRTCEWNQRKRNDGEGEGDNPKYWCESENLRTQTGVDVGEMFFVHKWFPDN